MKPVFRQEILGKLMGLKGCGTLKEFLKSVHASLTPDLDRGTTLLPSQISGQLKSIQLSVAFALFILGGVVLFGWVAGIEPLTRINPAFASMQFNTALCFLLVSFAVTALAYEARRLALAPMTGVFAIGSLTLTQYVFGIDIGIDLLFFNSQLVAHAPIPGRMSPVTAFAFALAGLIMLADAAKFKMRSFKIFGASTLLALGTLTVFGYATGLNLLEDWSPYIRVALHTGIGLLLIGTAALVREMAQTQTQAQAEVVDGIFQVFTLVLFALVVQINFESKSLSLLVLLGVVVIGTHLRLTISRKRADSERSKALRNSKLASLGEMSAGIAHEINNPLAIISGTARLLPKMVGDPAKLSERINTIERAAERIAKIVGSLRKFSRSSEKPEYKIHSLNEIAREALILTGAKAQRHGIKIEAKLSSAAQVLCDEIEMEQVVVNLVNNAIDAAKKGSNGWVKIEVFEEFSATALRIQDSGAGISTANQARLFHPFFTTKPTGEGTGLGLSIVKGILDEHKATIEFVAKSPNTCFEIRFPMAGVRQDAA